MSDFAGDADYTLKPRYIYKYHIYALTAQGETGLFLGTVYAHDEVEAHTDAVRLFSSKFKYGFKVVSATLN